MTESARTDFTGARRRMIDTQIADRGITRPDILAAFDAVPREAFVPPAQRDRAYDDTPLPIAADQTISQPYIVALMIAAARIAPGARVLEIGAGSGYAAAVISRIAGQVIGIERHATLAADAAARLARLGFDNVRIETGDGSAGWPADAPFDAILVAASGRHIPDALCAQIAPGGALVMPVGAPGDIQRLIRVTRTATGMQKDDLGPVRFVPLIGAAGWDSDSG